MQFDKSFHKCQANPRTCMMHIYSVKTVENIPNMFHRNHRTGVSNGKTNPTPILFCQRRQTNGYLSIFRSKLESIRKKIKINAFQFFHVRQCMIIRIRQLIKREMNMFLSRCCKKRLIPPLKRRKNIYRNRCIFHHTILILSKIQNLIDQTQKDIHIPLNQHQHPMLVSIQCFISQ